LINVQYFAKKVTATSALFIKCLLHHLQYNQPRFLPRDAMPSCGVCLSVTFADSVKANKHIFKIFPPSGRQAILVFPYQTTWQYSDGNPLTGASNAGRVGSNCDSEPISGFIACCQRCNRLGVINTTCTTGPRSRRLWHLSLVVSSRVCWWWETTTKCLWQEVSKLS